MTKQKKRTGSKMLHDNKSGEDSSKEKNTSKEVPRLNGACPPTNNIVTGIVGLELKGLNDD